MMDEELKNLKEWLDEASSFELPSFKELPTVPLYMEQVTAYINKTLAPMSPKDNEILTSFMVNNYVKAKIIKEPIRKKYNEEHLGYLLAICSLKNSLTMAELSHLIALDNEVSDDKSVLYGFFRIMSKGVYKDTISLAQKRVERFAKEYEETKEKDPEAAQQRLVDSLGLVALRMSIQASVYRIVSEALLDTIEKGQSSDVAYQVENKKHHKEIKHKAKAGNREAERIANAKHEIVKEKKKSEKEKEKQAKKAKEAEEKKAKDEKKGK